MAEISGKVIHGDHYGRSLGFPTANLDRRAYARKKLNIKFGIWQGSAVVGTGFSRPPKIYHAAVIIGPVDKNQLPKLEAHLLNFKGSLYGKKITISLKKYLRPFKKFKSGEQLKKQIKQDIIKIKRLAQ